MADYITGRQSQYKGEDGIEYRRCGVGMYFVYPYTVLTCRSVGQMVEGTCALRLCALVHVDDLGRVHREWTGYLGPVLAPEAWTGFREMSFRTIRWVAVRGFLAIGKGYILRSVSILIIQYFNMPGTGVFCSSINWYFLLNR